LPRAPDLRSARLLCLALLALGPWIAVGPADPGPVSTLERDGGCRLVLRAPGAPCPCDALPTRIRWALGLPIRLDRADADDLALIPGIGPTRAERIIADRETRGAFGRVDDLARVKGIGPVMVERLRPYAVAQGADPACTGGRVYSPR
jgi:competence ComEA-like helix-hairpin-helix protein